MGKKSLKDYVVVTCEGVDNMWKFNNTCSELVEGGYEPYERLVVTSIHSGENTIFSQAFILCK